MKGYRFSRSQVDRVLIALSMELFRRWRWGCASAILMVKQIWVKFIMNYCWLHCFDISLTQQLNTWPDMILQLLLLKSSMPDQRTTNFRGLPCRWWSSTLPSAQGRAPSGTSSSPSSRCSFVRIPKKKKKKRILLFLVDPGLYIKVDSMYNCM